jgi:hypothetical protein
MGFREDGAHTRGASSESINSLPVYKFKTKKRHRGSGSGNGAGSEAGFEGGVLGPGTDKERVISAEDAVSIFLPRPITFVIYLFIFANAIQHYSILH